MAEMCAGWPSMMASQRKTYLAAAALWSGSRAVPGSLHGGQMATYASPATARVRESCWVGVNTVEGSGMDRGDDSHSGGDGGKFASTCVHGFWWGSAPQMLLVQQPEWVIHGCKAMEAKAWTHPRGRERVMPWQLTSWAVQPARSDP